MSFGTIVFTNRGRGLQAKAMAGAQIIFTRIAIGDGQLGGQAAQELTALVHPVKSLELSAMAVLPGGKAKVSAILTNQGISSGFHWRELGVYAQDPDLGEILYCYGNAGALAEYIPAQGGSEILEKHVNVICIVGNAANVSATIEQSLAYATFQDLTDHKNDTSAHGLAGKVSHALATAADQFLVSSGVGAFAVKTVAQIKGLLGLETAAYTDSSAYATAAQGTKADNAATQTAFNALLTEFNQFKAASVSDLQVEIDANDSRLSGTKKADTLTWSGQCAYATTSTSASVALADVTLTNLRLLQYSVIVRLKTANNTLAADAVKIEVQKNISGVFTTASTLTLKPTDFANTADYACFYLPFDYKGGKATSNQIRIVITLLAQTSAYEVRLDSIVVVPVALGTYASN